MPTAGRGAPPPARRRHHHRRSVLLSWFHGRVVVSAVDGTRGRIMVVKRAVPISTLELQSRVEHADAMTSSAQRLMSLAWRSQTASAGPPLDFKTAPPDRASAPPARPPPA